MDRKELSQCSMQDGAIDLEDFTLLGLLPWVESSRPVILKERGVNAETHTCFFIHTRPNSVVLGS